MKAKDLLRFQKFIELDLLTGCWLWKGHLRNSYGLYKLNGKTVSAHRVAFVYWNGEIGKGLEIDHLCRNKNCVNPSHLESVTRFENIRRGLNPASINMKKTHCIHGHELSGDNLMNTKNWKHSTNQRCCKICKNLSNVRYRMRLKCL